MMQMSDAYDMYVESTSFCGKPFPGRFSCWKMHVYITKNLKYFPSLFDPKTRENSISSLYIAYALNLLNLSTYMYLFAPNAGKKTILPKLYPVTSPQPRLASFRVF